MEIQPQLLTMQRFLDGRLFRIPQYQRAYSWGKKQRDDLFEDIKRVQATDEEHFMATIVGLERKKDKKQIGADQYSLVEIVDGQQRLTTLILLLKAIHKALDTSIKEEKRLKAELARLLVKDDEHTLLLLQTNHDTSGAFADYIRDGKVANSIATTTADQNILDAIEECEGFVRNWKSSNASVVELTGIIRHRLSAVFHIVDDEALVYRVFEVLNSRGLDVASIDKLKSQLMGSVFEQGEGSGRNEAIKELHDIWRDIYQTIGKQRFGTETLRFAATLMASHNQSHKRPLGEQAALETLTKIAGKKPKNIIKCAKWLQKIVNAEDKLLANNRWRAVTRILQARLVAIAVFVRKFDSADEAKILSLWESVTFRIYGLGGGDKRTKVGDYTALAWEIVNDSLTVPKVMERLCELGKDYRISALIDKFDPSDCYNGWTEELRYFCFRYEEYLAHKAGQKLNESQWNRIWAMEPAKSIEHIKPQSSKVSYMHHLGNLMMLPPGMNSSLRDDDPAKKAKKYHTCGLLSSVEVGELIEANSGWNHTIAEERTKRLLEWARTQWKD